MNDHMTNFFVKHNPARFLGFATVPLQGPAAAATELERAVKELGFVGANINSYTNIGDENTDRYLDEQPVWELWAHVQTLGVPVYLHPRVPLPNQQRICQGYEGLLGSAWRFGFKTSIHAIRMIRSDLFDHYPGRPPMDYLRNNFYLTTSCTFRSQALLNTILELGTDRVLFSVDYPHESVTSPLGSIPARSARIIASRSAAPTRQSYSSSRRNGCAERTNILFRH
jgi:predicted TIM-barrel fold metal-dependent hydrolase